MTELELIERLGIYEDNFETAIKSGYTRNITRKNLEIIRDTYNAYTKQNHKPCLQCGSAIVQLLKDVGVLYFNVKEKINKIEQEKVEIVENDQSSTAREIVAGEVEQINREVENKESDRTKKKRTKRSNETKGKSDKKK